MKLLSLRSGRLGLDLAPQAGGSIARFTADGSIDLLRPATPEAVASGRGNDSSCYPLVPFSGRIANGRFVFDGSEIVLKPNWPGVRHPMHGDGWARPWSVARSDGHSADIVYEHDPREGWPFRYRARQTYRLDGDTLSIGISIENLEDRPVPAGLGLHPFFVRDADAELACRTRQVWLTDAEVLPTERIAVPPKWDFAQVAQGRRGHGRQRLRGLGRPRHDRAAQGRASSRDGSDGAVPRRHHLHPAGPALFLRRTGEPYPGRDRFDPSRARRDAGRPSHAPSLQPLKDHHAGLRFLPQPSRPRRLRLGRRLGHRRLDRRAFRRRGRPGGLRRYRRGGVARRSPPGSRRPAIRRRPFARCDVRDIAAYQAAIAEMAGRLGPVTVLINNAARDDRHTLEEVTPAYWDERIAVNLRHQFFAIQAIAPGMKKAGGGSIVNFSSVSYHTMTADLAVYQAAKAAVIGLTRGLARDLGPDRIRLNAITPGWIMTQRQIDLWLTPEAEAGLMQAQCLKEKLYPPDIARMALWLGADDSRLVTAQNFVVDGGRM